MALPLDIPKKVSFEEDDIGHHIDSPALEHVVAEVKSTCVAQVEQQLVAASRRGHRPRLATDVDVERRGLINRRSATVTVSWGLPFCGIVLRVVGFSSALRWAVAPDRQTRFGWTIGELSIVAHIFADLHRPDRTVGLLDCQVLHGVMDLGNTSEKGWSCSDPDTGQNRIGGQATVTQNSYMILV